MFAVLVTAGYFLMYISQSFGPEIIELLHGTEARVNALALKYDNVKPDQSLEDLCNGYDAHHFDPISNCSHAAGMILVFISIFVYFITGKHRILLTLVPIWYLYAWIGHFFMQKDIPAVFVYGMTLQGWLSGEYCSVCSLIMGRTISEPWEIIMTTCLIILHMSLLQPVKRWGFTSKESKE
jgi:hypothetical protein